MGGGRWGLDRWNLGALRVWRVAAAAGAWDGGAERRTEEKLSQGKGRVAGPGHSEPFQQVTNLGGSSRPWLPMACLTWGNSAAENIHTGQRRVSKPEAPSLKPRVQVLSTLATVTSGTLCTEQNNESPRRR